MCINRLNNFFRVSMLGKPSHMKKTKRKHKTVKLNVYSTEEYNSGDGMLTSVWGPPMWHYLHTMSFNYPVLPTNTQKRKYRSFVLSLQHVLPCKYCRMNLTKNLASLPLTMDVMASRNTFSRYIFALHELVNKMLNKTSNLTFEEVRERYEHFRSRCTDTGIPMATATTPTTLSNHKTHKRKGKKEMGCTQPLYKGKKSKCILKIVPQEEKGSTFQMDKKCMKRRNLTLKNKHK
jgi:hypothetical protein